MFRRVASHGTRCFSQDHIGRRIFTVVCNKSEGLSRIMNALKASALDCSLDCDKLNLIRIFGRFLIGVVSKYLSNATR